MLFVVKKIYTAQTLCCYGFGVPISAFINTYPLFIHNMRYFVHNLQSAIKNVDNYPKTVHILFKKKHTFFNKNSKNLLSATYIVNY